MKLLIFSDSHGSAAPLYAVTRRERPDLVLHLGDGSRDVLGLEYPPALLQVRGNCDGWGCDYEDDMLVNIGGVNIFVTHGHRYGVKSGLDTLASAAAAKGAQVACFGHTHKPFCEYRDGVLLINPGTCTLRGACALLTIDQSGSFQAELL